MAILAFQKPEHVNMLESSSTFGKFEFRPLEPGFGQTIGNALRRILLSSLEGYAITTVKIAGVDHEFAAIPGVMEGMIDIVLNLKKVNFIKTVDSEDSEKVTINVAGVTELTAGYISNFLSNFKVLNPDLVICHMAPDTKLTITLTIDKGRGYVPAEENRPIGRWGRMHREFLREHKPIIFNQLCLSGELWGRLADINEQAEQRMAVLVRQMQESEGVTETLKEADQMGWVRRMNNIRNRAEEIVVQELICK